MRFCDNCGRSMRRDLSSGAVVFRCVCGTEEAGAPEDARISGAVLGAGETAEKFQLLIRDAAFDRTNQQVLRDCPDCGRDYMTQIRVGENEVIIYKCRCGREEAAGQ